MDRADTSPHPTLRAQKSIVRLVGCLTALLSVPALVFLVESFYPLSFAEWAWVGAGAWAIAIAYRVRRAHAKGKKGLIAFLLVAVALVLTVAYRVRPSPFDAEGWRRAGQARDGDTQQRMLPSLRRMLDRGGIASRAAAIETLGPSGKTRSREEGTREVFTWDLGAARGLLRGIDSCYLWLAFDEEGKLVSHGVSYYD